MLPYNNKIISAARNLRKDMTPQEKRLWYDFLRNHPAKFYRQRIIENFIVDFYCAKAKLVIELDGSQHYTVQGIAHDEGRASILESLDLKIIRFANPDIDTNFSGVCAVKNETVENRIKKGI